jgi:hypothetical protein
MMSEQCLPPDESIDIPGNPSMAFGVSFEAIAFATATNTSVILSTPSLPTLLAAATHLSLAFSLLNMSFFPISEKANAFSIEWLDYIPRTSRSSLLASFLTFYWLVLYFPTCFVHKKLYFPTCFIHEKSCFPTLWNFSAVCLAFSRSTKRSCRSDARSGWAGIILSG